MSLIDPTTCGFGKIAAYTILTGLKPKEESGESLKNYKGRVTSLQLEEFKKQFSNNEKFIPTYKQFRDNFPLLIKSIKNYSKRHKPTIEKLKKLFSKKEWDLLPIVKQENHQLFDCQACCNDYKNEISLFPLPPKALKFRKKATENGIISPQALKDVTNQAIQKLDEEFSEKYQTTFSEQLKQKFKSVENCNNKIKENKTKSIAQSIVKNTEKQWKETEVLQALSFSTSFRKRQKMRLLRGFEPMSDAIMRQQKENEAIKQGTKRKRDHVGILSKYTWKKEECITKYERLSEEERNDLNYSAFAREFEVKQNGATPPNASQVLKKLLRECGFNVPENDEVGLRRKKRKLELPNLKEVSIPIESTNDDVIKHLKEQIKNNIYTLGELIVPQKFIKIFIDKNDKVIAKEVFIQGRKIPFSEIRLEMNQDHKKYMRLKTDDEISNATTEEIINYLKSIHEYNENDTIQIMKQKVKTFQRTRHLMLWHDGSSISDHGHILMTLSAMYDPAVYLTVEEIIDKYKTNMNIQGFIERPYVYILARCPSTGDEQLMYSDERLEDIISLNSDTTLADVPIKDKIRIFKGDAPAASFEIGHQKGGNYFCWTCDINSNVSNDVVATFNSTNLSLQDRLDKIKKSFSSCNKVQKFKTNLYDKISKVDIINELHQREVMFSEKESVDSLQNKLKNEMCGIQRLPALLFHQPDATLEQLNLNEYEILNNEPLHDISHHTENLYEELPNHVSKTFKPILKELIKASFNNKEAKNSADYRRSLLILVNQFIQNDKYIQENKEIFEILVTLSEIQEILYLSDDKRSPITILRLINVTFNHAILLKKIIKKNPISLTKRKLFGVYYHSLVRHAPEQYRVISGRASNTEKEESIFCHMKKDTKMASNHHPNNVLINALLRHQAKKYLNEHEIPKNTESFLHKLYNNIKPKLTNTIIPFKFIENQPDEYQCMLERQADFLIDADCWWKETESGVLFLDTGKQVTSKRLSHFRSTTVSNELEFVKECWEQCLLKKDTLIPAFKIKIYQKNNTTYSSITLKTLNHFFTKSQATNNPTVFNNLKKQFLASTPKSKSNTTKVLTNNEVEHSLSSIDISPQVPIAQNSLDESTHSFETPSTLNLTAITRMTELQTEDSAVENQVYQPISKSDTLTQLKETQIYHDKSESKGTDTPSPIKDTEVDLDKNEFNNKESFIEEAVQEAIETVHKKSKQKEHIIKITPKAYVDNPSKAYGQKSKTSQLLSKIIDDENYIATFDNVYKEMKAQKCSRFVLEKHSLFVAQLEIKIKLLEYTWKSKLKKIEQQQLQESASLNIQPDNNEEYEVAKKKLKNIKTFKKLFKF